MARRSHTGWDLQGLAILTGSSVPARAVSSGATLPAGDTRSCLLTSAVVTTRGTPVIEWGGETCWVATPKCSGQSPPGTPLVLVSVVLRQRPGFQGAQGSLPLPRDPVLHLGGFGHGTSLLWICVLSLSRVRPPALDTFSFLVLGF